MSERVERKDIIRRKYMRWNEEKEEKFCFNIVTTIDDHLSLIHPN